MVAASQTTQTAPAGTNVNDPPRVIVRDISGVPVSGVVVTFAVTAGGGTITGSPATTNALGIAALTAWKLGNAIGTNTVTATSPGLPSVTFNATAAAGVPTNVVATAGINRPRSPEPPSPRTRRSRSPMPTATRRRSAGDVHGDLRRRICHRLNQVTDALGLAVVGSWTLGASTPNTLRATVTGSGITGNPVTFTAQSATQITITTAPAGPIRLGTNFSITVQLRNSAGAAVSLAGNSAIASLGRRHPQRVADPGTLPTGSATFTAECDGRGGRPDVQDQRDGTDAGHHRLDHLQLMAMTMTRQDRRMKSAPGVRARGLRDS